MKKAMKNQLLLQWKDWLIGYSILIVASLAGIVLMYAIVTFSSAEDTYITMGGLFGGIVLIFYCGIMVLVQMSTGFNLAISMGQTRKRFFAVYYVSLIAGTFLGLALVLLVFCLENHLYPLLYPGLENEIDFLSYLIPYSIPLMVLFNFACGLCGSLLLRFGRKAFWVLWSAWMFGCLGFPRIIDAAEDAPDSLFGMLGNGILQFVKAIPVNAWIISGILSGILCLLFSYRILSRQQVTG